MRTILLLLAVVGQAAIANSITLSHPYGDLIDRGETTATWSVSAPGGEDCRVPPHLYWEGREITISVRRLAPGSAGVACTAALRSLSLGMLAAGWWTVVLRVFDADGATLIERVPTDWRVRVPGTSCNRFPGDSSLIVRHATLDASGVIDRLARDAEFAARLGSPIGARPGSTIDPRALRLDYPLLEDPRAMRDRIEATGEFDWAQINGYGCWPIPPAPGNLAAKVVEYYHSALDHYFYTADPGEIAGLDAGTGAKGWTRTGEDFDVWVNVGCPFLGDAPQMAYRFFGKPGVGPSSHFFTVDREECRIVDHSGQWLYEGIPYFARPAGPSGCLRAGEISLFRAWKPFGDANHRFTTRRAVVDAMVAQGWVDEGAAMCVLAPR